MTPTLPPSSLERLAATIAERARTGDATSYTRKLLEGGPERIGKKVGEEAVEVVIAALGQDRTALTNELADLFYHLFVLMEAKGISLQDVGATLDGRMGRSGLEEKAARQQP